MPASIKPMTPDTSTNTHMNPKNFRLSLTPRHPLPANRCRATNATCLNFPATQRYDQNLRCLSVHHTGSLTSPLRWRRHKLECTQSGRARPAHTMIKVGHHIRAGRLRVSHITHMNRRKVWVCRETWAIMRMSQDSSRTAMVGGIITPDKCNFG